MSHHTSNPTVQMLRNIQNPACAKEHVAPLLNPRNIAGNRQKPSATQAFSLIELLTVVAVIAIITSITIPIIGKARSNAERTTCMSNMRQIGGMMSLFISENDGMFPGFGGLDKENQSGSKRWMHQLYPYVRGSGPGERMAGEPYAMSIFICPTSQTIYGMNNRLQGYSTYNADGTVSQLAVQNFARTIVLAERGAGADGHPSFSESAPYPTNFNYGIAAAHGNGDDGKNGFTGGAGSHLLFADMHVEFVTQWPARADSPYSFRP